jgi:hypothetical protein
MSVINLFKASVVIDDTTYQVTRDMTAYEYAQTLDIELPAAKAGALTTRTSNSQGTATMGASHGIQTGDRIDVYWEVDTGSGQTTKGCRRGMTVGTVSGTSVPLSSSGTGDNLPLVATLITAMVPALQTVSMDADAFTAWGASFKTSANVETDKLATLSVGNTSGSYTEGAAVLFNRTGGVWNGQACWNDAHMETNPLDAANTFTKVYVSHGDSTRTLFFKFGGAVA